MVQFWRRGGAGNDVLRGTGGDDYLEGGAGDDTLLGLGGDDLLRGGPGSDRIDGGYGNDTASFFDAAGRVSVILAEQATMPAFVDGDADWLTSIENVNGGAWNDFLSGDAGANRLRGFDGDDWLSGQGGDDWLVGGRGDDRLEGGAGNDRIEGGEGRDTASWNWSLFADGVRFRRDGAWILVVTPDGTDRVRLVEEFEFTGMRAGPSYLTVGLVEALARTGDDAIGTVGDDLLQGGAGNDAFLAGPGSDTLLGGDGNDWLFGGLQSRTIYADPDAGDRLEGGAGDDILGGGNGDDVLIGGAGRDTADFSESWSLPPFTTLGRGRLGVQVDLALAGPQNIRRPTPDWVMDGFQNPTEFDTLEGIENLAGSFADDVLRGDARANRLSGRDGDDRLEGRGGDDLLDGGDGFDTAVFASAWSAVTRVTFEGARIVVVGPEGRDVLTGIEAVEFAGVAVSLAGLRALVAGTALVAGGEGDDTLAGTPGSEVMVGGAGADLLQGSAGRDWIEGGTGPLDGTILRYGYHVEIDPSFDTVDYGDAPSGVAVDLRRQGTPQDTGGAGVDTLLGIEGVIGSAFGDVLRGDPGVFDNERGSLVARSGTALLAGGAGDDVLGGVRIGGRLEGGAGADRFVFAEPQAVTRVADFEAAVDRLDFRALDAEPGDFRVYPLREGIVRIEGLRGGDAPLFYFVADVTIASGTFDLARDALF